MVLHCKVFLNAGIRSIKKSFLLPCSRRKIYIDLTNSVIILRPRTLIAEAEKDKKENALPFLAEHGGLITLLADKDHAHEYHVHESDHSDHG